MQNIQDIVSHVLRDLESPKKKKHGLLIDQWPSIAGPRIAPHTKPILGQGGRLNVWVDQSTLAFELRQRYQQILLKRAQAVLGEEEIKTIRFYIGQLR